MVNAPRIYVEKKGVLQLSPVTFHLKFSLTQSD